MQILYYLTLYGEIADFLRFFIEQKFCCGLFNGFLKRLLDKSFINNLFVCSFILVPKILFRLERLKKLSGMYFYSFIRLANIYRDSVALREI